MMRLYMRERAVSADGLSDPADWNTSRHTRCPIASISESAQRSAGSMASASLRPMKRPSVLVADATAATVAGP